MTFLRNKREFDLTHNGQTYHIEQYEEVEKFSVCGDWTTLVDGEAIPKRFSWDIRTTKHTKREIIRFIENYL